MHSFNQTPVFVPAVPQLGDFMLDAGELLLFIDDQFARLPFDLPFSDLDFLIYATTVLDSIMLQRLRETLTHVTQYSHAHFVTSAEGKQIIDPVYANIVGNCLIYAVQWLRQNYLSLEFYDNRGICKFEFVRKADYKLVFRLKRKQHAATIDQDSTSVDPVDFSNVSF